VEKGEGGGWCCFDESFDVLVKTGESYPTKARKRDVRAGDDDAPPRAVA
jgi:hypothetical protein